MNESKQTKEAILNPDGVPSESNGPQNQAEPSAEELQLQPRWERLQESHRKAGEAFQYTVLAGIEIVELKLVLRHGDFTRLAHEQIPTLGERTLRRYRVIGEWYLSAAHHRVVTVKELRKTKSQPEPEVCSPTAVADYLADHGVATAEDLQSHVRQSVPEVFEVKKGPGKMTLERLLHYLERIWTRLTPERQDEVFRRLAELRSRETAEPPSGHPLES